MKVCSRCTVEKSKDDFHRRAASKDGRSVWCKACYAEYNAERYRANPRAALMRHRLYSYGVTEEEFEQHVQRQSGRCAACGEVPPVFKVDGWTVDHCHTTGRVRGLLCQACNRSLGLMKESPKRIRGLAQYAEDLCA